MSSMNVRTMTAEQIAEGLSARQARWIVNAYPLSGPSGDYIVLDDSKDPLDHDLAHPVTGRLTPLGLVVRSILKARDHE